MHKSTVKNSLLKHLVWASSLIMLVTTSGIAFEASASSFVHQAGVEVGTSYLHLREPDDDTRNINFTAAGLYRPVPFLVFGLGIQVSIFEMLLESEDNNDISGAPLMFPLFAELQLPLGNHLTLRARGGRALGLYRYDRGTCETYFRFNGIGACTDGKYTEKHVGDYFGGSLAFRQDEGMEVTVGFNRLQLPNMTRFNLYEIGFRVGFY